MKSIKIRHVIALAILLFALDSAVVAQSRHVKQREKELGQKEEDRAAEQEAADAEAKERFMSIQSKSTRKEMKRYKKMSKRVNKNRRDPFFTRVFRKKR